MAQPQQHQYEPRHFAQQDVASKEFTTRGFRPQVVACRVLEDPFPVRHLARFGRQDDVAVNAVRELLERAVREYREGLEKHLGEQLGRHLLRAA